MVQGNAVLTKKWKRPGSIIAIVFATSAQVEFCAQLRQAYDEVNSGNILFDVLFVSGTSNTMWRKNCFILDSRRVLAPAPKVLGPKHISNPDFAPF